MHLFNKCTATASRSRGLRADERNTVFMDALSYRVILEPDQDDGGFNVIIPAFPTAHTQGNDVEDALGNAREVIALELGFLRDKSLPIPPSDAENARVERVTVVLPAA